MSSGWRLLDRVDTPQGRLELAVRGEGEFSITLDGRRPPRGSISSTPSPLGRLGCEALAGRPRPRVLLGPLGMAQGLRGTLDALPADARVVVAEPLVALIRWCLGPLAALTGGAVSDPRVVLEVEEIAHSIARTAGALDDPDISHTPHPEPPEPSTPAARGENGAPGEPPPPTPPACPSPFDAILVDLLADLSRAAEEALDTLGDLDPLCGRRGLERALRALEPGGVLAIRARTDTTRLEERLRRAGFEVAPPRSPGRGDPAAGRGIDRVILARRP